MPRLRRRRLDLSLARAARARLRGSRALHVDHGLRGAESERTPAFCREALGAEIVDGRGGGHRGRAARDPLLVRDRAAARDRAHRVRPGRDGALPHGRLAARRAGSSAGARTASSARCSRAGATRPRGTAGRRGSNSGGTRRIRTRSAASSASGSCRCSAELHPPRRAICCGWPTASRPGGARRAARIDRRLARLDLGGGRLRRASTTGSGSSGGPWRSKARCPMGGVAIASERAGP